MNELEYCLGCSSLIDVYRPPAQIKQFCVYIISNSKGECPCSRCIVKIMCGVLCPSFYTFRQTVGAYHE